MISILLYHQIARISAECDPSGFDIPPESFENQMRYLHQAGYRCLNLKEALHYLKKNGSQPSKAFVLTFDDGFQELYYTVMPILDKFGFTATIFFVTGRAGCESNWNGKEGKFAEAERIFARQYSDIRANEDQLPDNRRFHKGTTLHNWGIAILLQKTPDRIGEDFKKVQL